MFKKFTTLLTMALIVVASSATAQNKIFAIDNFDVVVVSPHISVTFKKGTKASVEVLSITEPMDKFNVELKKNKLSLFLDDARIVTKSKKEKTAYYTNRKPIYKGTVARLLVTYTDIQEIELRGEEKFSFEDEIVTEQLKVRVFGESEVSFAKVALTSLKATLYGESHIDIAGGTVERQKITAYGETTVNTKNVESKETKLTAYGDGSFQLNVADKLKVTSYGEATIVYSGNAELNKGIVIGETNIVRKSAN